LSIVTPVLLVLLVGVGVPLVYLYALALAAVRPPRTLLTAGRRHRFIVAIAAHDEETVIGKTVSRLREQDYPSELFQVHIVADHCADRTADVARLAGAVVHERSALPRGSKGAALRWLFLRILGTTDAPAAHDAVVIFDADTVVERDFLRIMDARLSAGDQVIQGQHRIRNPEDGWFPALTWAMFIIDNRLQNLGRANLGWSAKNMGDSICFRADVLRRLGWGEGLTEDYAFRQLLLMEGMKIGYEPSAVGFGEAPLTWAAARRQRARWLRGAHDASQQYAHKLLVHGLRRRNLAILDGALQAHLPSYSSLTAIAVSAWLVQVGLVLTGAVPLSTEVVTVLALWSVTGAALFAYPMLGLALERAPLSAFGIILTGPIFIVWRSWLALASRRSDKQILWVRTPRRGASV